MVHQCSQFYQMVLRCDVPAMGKLEYIHVQPVKRFIMSDDKPKLQLWYIEKSISYLMKIN